MSSEPETSCPVSGSPEAVPLRSHSYGSSVRIKQEQTQVAAKGKDKTRQVVLDEGLCRLSMMLSSPSPSFSSPSSSAVTIPVPGKSILKQSAPAQNSLLSRITRFLPNQNQTQPGADDGYPLKRAHFILPEIAVVYPISSVNPPSTPTLKEEKRSIEDREYERRRRVLRGNSGSEKDAGDDFWSMEKVESFYRECCAGCDEEPDTAISAAFKVRLFLHYRLDQN